MFEEIGHHVEKIKRIRYGPMSLDLEPGQVRELTPNEVNLLRHYDAKKAAARPAVKRPRREPERKTSIKRKVR